MDFSELRRANIARDHEWVSPGAGAKLSLSFRGNELAGEVGEACNVIKKLEREQLGLIGSRATVGDLAEELADGVICIDLIAMDLDIDIGAAVKAKFNKTSEKRGLATRLEPSAALQDVVAERRRQVEAEGWTPEHDDEHAGGELASAASCYAHVASYGDIAHVISPADSPPYNWPFDEAWWKPGDDPRRMLVKAGALILAEIERLDRAAAKAGASS